VTLDLVYGKRRTMAKFKVLQIVARVPYQTWEHVAYIAVTHVHQSVGFAKRIQDRIVEARGQQDNELWHLLILQDLIAREGKSESQLKFFWLPQLIAFGYYQFSWLLYVVNPSRRSTAFSTRWPIYFARSATMSEYISRRASTLWTRHGSNRYGAAARPDRAERGLGDRRCGGHGRGAGPSPLGAAFLAL
jgi:hypothetical protein